MSEYKDIKNNRHKVIQRTQGRDDKKTNKEYREAAEREIVEALFRILKPKAEAEAK